MALDYLLETKYSAAYRSEYLSTLGSPNSNIWRILSNLPCSHIDSPTSTAPTLLSIKRHAQSICSLLQTLCVSTETVTIGSVPNKPGQAFDWLNDLTRPYQNEDTAHNAPLTTLINNLQAPTRSRHRSVDICPLHRHEVTDLDRTVALPNATHHAILKHANECLERLDHEYSASGGIMSLVPIDREEDDAAQIIADSTLIGQMLTYIQGLVVRNRELEICLDDMRGLVAGESIIPREILSEAGTVGRQAVQIFSHPQDRFIMAGITQEKWNWLCAELERQDVHEGMQSVEIVTTYTRLRGQTAMFISIDRLGNRRQEQAGPAVIKVVTPKWPMRSSLWEERYELELLAARSLPSQCVTLERKIERLENDVKVLEQERTHLKRWQAIAQEDPIQWSNFQRRFAWEAQEAKQNEREAWLKIFQDNLAKEATILERKKEEYERLYPPSS